MRLRELENDDAPFMLEWMHDKTVVKYLIGNFYSKTIDDCRCFISSSLNDCDNVHLAIEDQNRYIGTVSLKNIYDKTAEFAIVVCKQSMGKGIAIDAMREILKLGFEEFGLREIYWCVQPQNYRAIKFYEKNGFSITRLSSKLKEIIEDREIYSKEQTELFAWFDIDYDYYQAYIRKEAQNV